MEVTQEPEQIVTKNSHKVAPCRTIFELIECSLDEVNHKYLPPAIG